jgi:hypothetical protein
MRFVRASVKKIEPSRYSVGPSVKATWVAITLRGWAGVACSTTGSGAGWQPEISKAAEVKQRV